MLTLAGAVCSVLTELEDAQFEPVFVSDTATRRFLDTGELDICIGRKQIGLHDSRPEDPPADRVIDTLQ